MARSDIDLSNECRLLVKELRRFANQIRSQIPDIEDELLIPSEGIATTAGELRTRFQKLSMAVFDAADAAGISLSHASKRSQSLRDLMRAVDRIADRRNSQQLHLQTQAEELLNFVELLQGPVDELSGVKKLTADIRSAIHAGTMDAKTIDDLIGKKHPLSALFTLVSEGGDIDPEEGAELYSLIKNAFGESLAWAATRGQIILRPRRDRSEDRSVDTAIEDSGAARSGDSVEDDESIPGIIDDSLDRQESETEGDVRGTVLDDSLESSESDGERSDSFDAIHKPSKSAELDDADSDSSKTDTSSIRVRPRKGEVVDQSLLNTVNAWKTADEGELDPLLDILSWQLITVDRLDLAYQLSRCRDHLSHPSDNTLSTSALRALALARWIQGPQGLLPELIDEDFLSIIERIDLEQASKLSTARRLVYVAMSIRPMLLGSTTGSAGLLLSMLDLDHWPKLNGLRSAITQLAAPGVDLSPELLKGARERAVWDAAVRGVTTECMEWFGAARQARLNYQPATRVWQEIIGDKGAIGSAFHLIMQEDGEQLSGAESTIAMLGQQNTFERVIADLDYKLRGPSARRRPIDGIALRSLLKQAKVAAALLSKWVDVVSTEPQGKSDFHNQQIESYRQHVLECLNNTQDDLESMRCREEQDPALLAGLSTAISAIRNAASLFDPDASESSSPPAEHLLSKDLLTISGLDLDDDWNPIDPNWSQLLGALIATAISGEPDWLETIRMHLKDGNFQTAAYLVKYLNAKKWDQGELEMMEVENEEALRMSRSALSRLLVETQTELNRALSEALFPESEFKRMEDQIVGIEPETTVEIRGHNRTLSQIESRIQSARSLRVEEIQGRLESGPLSSADSQVVQRIRDALDRGDLPVAYDYIERAEKGEALPSPEVAKLPISEFFPKFVREMFSTFSDSKGDTRRVQIGRLAKRIKNREIIGPIDCSKMNSAQAKNAAEMYDAWTKIKQGAKSIERDVNSLLTNMGFRVESVHRTQGSAKEKVCWLTIKTATLADRSLCIIPQLGSQAGGQYQVLCLWDSNSVDAVFSAVNERRYDQPIIVFYTDRLSEVMRRRLTELGRSENRTVLVLDESLLCFLCCWTGPRLPTFFQCALPFTVADPYVTTASLVPPEMFFGRAQERRSIVDPVGTNLVYGGRQLGKTALLRDAERTHHDPDSGLCVKWIDLTYIEGIGEHRPIDDIWAVIANALYEFGVLKKPGVKRHETIQENVLRWLSEDPSRRIILLLDEADNFLGQDAEDDFRRLGYLKGLMDRTDRRFKVVFAGLHNVQRTSRNPNTPLAHLGTPICIGPLLDGGEWKEALAMISEPLRALGYEFESGDLPLRILAYTNYYPSLIQLFGKHLLAHLNSLPAARLANSGPPFIITRKEIDAVYQHDQELRNAILERFRWTLDLDTRYRVIALCIALETLGKRSFGKDFEGFSINWIRDDALNWWPKGFRDSTTLEETRTILEEMCGLGVLRNYGNNRYALRNPNVLRLLGTEEQMEQDLMDAALQEPRPVYSPANFHRRNPKDTWGRSPLTARQEGELFDESNGAVALFGSSVSGLDNIQMYLEIAVDEKANCHLQWLSDVRTRSDCQNAVTELSSRRDVELSLGVIPWESSWSIMWIIDALEILNRKTSRRHHTRILFLGDPALAWDWSRLDEPVQANVDKLGLVVLSLMPWSDDALRRWMLDNHFGPEADADMRRGFTKTTGNWHNILEHVGQRCKKDSPHRWEAHLEEVSRLLDSEKKWDANFGIFSDALGVFNAMVEMGEPMGEADILEWVEVLGEGSNDLARQALHWGELLSYVRREAEGKWSLDPVVERIVRRMAD